MYKKKLRLAKVKAIGSKSEVEAKESELLEELTVPTVPRNSQKRPLSDVIAGFVLFSFPVQMLVLVKYLVQLHIQYKYIHGSRTS